MLKVLPPILILSGVWLLHAQDNSNAFEPGVAVVQAGVRVGDIAR